MKQHLDSFRTVAMAFEQRHVETDVLHMLTKLDVLICLLKIMLTII